MAFDILNPIASITEPILQFGDDLFTTSEETTQYGIAQTNANASQTAAQAELLNAENAAAIAAANQMTAVYWIVGIITFVLIAGVFYTLNKK